MCSWKKKTAPWISFLPPIHHFPLLHLYLLSSQLNQTIFLFVSAAVTQTGLKGEMAISQTEIFLPCNFRSPKLKCVTGKLSLPAVVLLFFSTYKHTKSNFGTWSDKGEKKGFLQLQQALTDRISRHHSSFTVSDLWYPQHSSPLLSPFFFLLGLSHPLLRIYHVPAFLRFLSYSSSLPLDLRGGLRRRVYSAQGLSCYRVLNAMETKFLLHNSVPACVCAYVCVCLCVGGWVPDKYGHFLA